MCRMIATYETTALLVTTVCVHLFRLQGLQGPGCVAAHVCLSANLFESLDLENFAAPQFLKCVRRLRCSMTCLVHPPSWRPLMSSRVEATLKPTLAAQPHRNRRQNRSRRLRRSLSAPYRASRHHHRQQLIDAAVFTRSLS